MSQFAGKADPEPLNGAGDEWGSERRGSLAWLQAQPHVDVNGRELPAVHRVPPGASWRSDEERGTRCALVRPDGSGCGAPGTRLYGVCLVHLGGGVDPASIAAKGGSARGTIAARARIVRQTFGIQGNSPRAVARMLTAERSAEVAAALLAPLDDRKLGSMERQRAASVLLAETFPLASASLEVELPADAADVGSMGWADMQALAASLLT